jgi:hypothetical protein
MRFIWGNKRCMQNFCEEAPWKVATFSVEQAVKINMIIHMHFPNRFMVYGKMLT